jgi:hypothetical protein
MGINIRIFSIVLLSILRKNECMKKLIIKITGIKFEQFKEYVERFYYSTLLY